MTDTTDAPITTHPIAECVSVRSVSKGKWYYYEAGLYEARARKDGVVTWRFVGVVGSAHRSRTLAETKAAAAATRLGVPYLPTVRHGAVYAGAAAKTA